MENTFDIKRFLIENKLTRLSEDNSEWEVEAPKEWGRKDLEPGLVIPKSIWNKQAILDYFDGDYNSWEELIDELPSYTNLVNNSWKFKESEYDPFYEKNVITLVNTNNPNEKQYLFQDEFNLATNSEYNN